MRGLVSSAAVLVTLVLVAPASASDHLMKINEILPSGAGGAQFVELVDPAPEPFGAPPYRLVVHSPSGAVVGRHTLVTAQLVGNTAHYLVANAAQGGAPDEVLTVALPPAGQVCFTRGAPEARIHCVAYGCPAFAPFASEGGSRVALGYGAGQSLQRGATGDYGPGQPTPDAANLTLSALPCGMPPGGGGARGGADTRRPVVILGGRKRQRLSRLSVTVTLDEAAGVVATGSVKIGKVRRKLRRVTRSLAAGRRARLRLRVSRRTRAAVLRALGDRRRVTASVKVTATDAARNVGVARRTIRLRR